MKLDVFAGKKKLFTLVPHFPIDPVTKKLSGEWKGNYAIPGGSKFKEEVIRKWANTYGYVIKKVYEDGDYDENISVS